MSMFHVFGPSVVLYCLRAPYQGKVPAGERIVGPDVVVQPRWNGPRGYLGEHHGLPKVAVLRCVCPDPVEVRARLDPMIDEIRVRYPRAVVDIRYTNRFAPPPRWY